MKVKLEKIIDGLEMQTEESGNYLDKRTGVVFLVNDEDLRRAESGGSWDRYSEWEREAIEQAEEMLENEEHFIRLPDQYEINEYNIMERFSFIIESETISDAVYSSLKGKGAFRRFRDTLSRYDLTDEWYKFRDNALRQIAIEWCESNGLDYDEN